MRSRWWPQNPSNGWSSPGRDALRLLVTHGLRPAVLIAVAALVAAWPWQSLLVYLALLALTVPAAVVETRTLRRTRRDQQRSRSNNPTPSQ